MKEFEFPSQGAGMIHAYRWEPESKPVAVVQLIHGIAEHLMRYDDFARYLNSKGYLVVGEDHMGHGKSHGGTAPLYFDGGWTAAAEDSYTLLRRTREEFPDLPYFLFGHSMGSFLTRTLLFLHPEADLSGAVICGTAWQPKPVLGAGRALCAIEAKRLGTTAHSKLLTRLIFGAYNVKFKDHRTPNDWICSSAEVVDRYGADPLCGGEATVGLTKDMLGGIAMIQKKSNLKKMPRALPVFFIAGKSDPVGSMGKGVQKAYEKFKSAGMEHVEVKLYDGRHEILNEDHHEVIYTDVLAFLEKNR